jgi:hypothetical protein
MPGARLARWVMAGLAIIVILGLVATSILAPS